MTELHELSEHECTALLHAGGLGRVAVATPTGPHIVPVNYSVLDDAIILCTSPYSLLGTYGRESTFAFEIDGFDDAREGGWSVQARGRVEVVTDREELAQIRRSGQPQPLAGGVRQLCLRLRWTELTGRRLGESWNPSGDGASRRTS